MIRVISYLQYVRDGANQSYLPAHQDLITVEFKSATNFLEKTDS